MEKPIYWARASKFYPSMSEKGRESVSESPADLLGLDRGLSQKIAKQLLFVDFRRELLGGKVPLL